MTCLFALSLGAWEKWRCLTEEGKVGDPEFSGNAGSSILLAPDLESRMTIEQLARATRLVFEQHYESLTGLPFFTCFPLNCCQRASVVFGMLAMLLHTQHTVTVVKGDTRDGRESQGWSMA